MARYTLGTAPKGHTVKAQPKPSAGGGAPAPKGRPMPGKSGKGK